MSKEQEIQVKLTADTSSLHKELDAVAARVKSIKADFEDSGIMGAFFNFFKGRSTTFAIAFLVTGFILEWKGRLSGNFVGLAGIIQSLVVFHSVKEDFHARNLQQAGDDKDAK